MFPSKTAILSGGAGLVNQYSLAFDGTDGYIACGNRVSFDITDDITMACWVKSSTLPTSSASETIMGRDDGTNRSYVLYIGEDSGTVKFYWDYFVSGSPQRVVSTTNLSVDTWYHVVCTRDKATGANIIYVNGVAEDTDTDSTASIDNDDIQFAIGARGNGANFFEGNLDEVAIWNAVLTAGQVSGIYNAKGRIDLKTVSGSNLKGWWRMGDAVLDDGNIAGNGLIADQVTATLGSDLITNGTMEANANWGDGDLAPTSQERSSEQAKNGTYSWKFVVPGSGGAQYGGIKNTTAFTTVTGNVYRLKYWIYGDVTSHNLSITEGDGSGKITGFSDYWVQGQTAGQWNEIIYYYREEGGGSSGYIEIEGSGSAATYYVDDVSLVLVNGNPGVMVNFDGSDIVTDVPS